MNSFHLFKESLGWLAMVAFSASYLCKNAVALRRAQAGAAGVWVLYGLASGAAPVVFANVVVVFMAVVYPVIKARLERPTEEPAKTASDPVASPVKRQVSPRQDIPMAQPFGW